MLEAKVTQGCTALQTKSPFSSSESTVSLFTSLGYLGQIPKTEEKLKYLGEFAKQEFLSVESKVELQQNPPIFKTTVLPGFLGTGQSDLNTLS